MIIWRGWDVLALIVGVIVHLVIAFVFEQTLGISDSAMKAIALNTHGSGLLAWVYLPWLAGLRA